MKRKVALDIIRLHACPQCVKHSSWQLLSANEIRKLSEDDYGKEGWMFFCTSCGYTTGVMKESLAGAVSRAIKMIKVKFPK